MILARVHISLPAEAQIVFAVIGAILVGLFLIAWFVGTFGKKGLIAIGVLLALFVLGVGVFVVVEQLGYQYNARVRQAQARANVARIRALLAAKPSSDQPLEKACKAFIAPEPRGAASRPPTSVTLAWASDAPTQQLVHVFFEPKSHALPGDSEPIDLDLERALLPEFFVVARKERVGAGWLVTLTVDRDGETCTGSVTTKSERLPDDEAVAIGVCSRMGRQCGVYEKQFQGWF